MKVEETVFVTSRDTRHGYAETRCVWRAGGLAVTQWLGRALVFDWDGSVTPTPSREGKYVVTHLPTGNSVDKDVFSEADAIALAESLVPLADWANMTLTDLARGLSRREEWTRTVAAAILAFRKSRTPTSDSSPA